jgi:hypothetical protein
MYVDEVKDSIETMQWNNEKLYTSISN